MDSPEPQTGDRHRSEQQRLQRLHRQSLDTAELFLHLICFKRIGSASETLFQVFSFPRTEGKALIVIEIALNPISS